LFHAGHDDKRNISAYWTERIMSAYNAPLRQYLTAGHYMDTLAAQRRIPRRPLRRALRPAQI
jgi:hypothetical protein